MKKTIATILTIVMTVGLLAGCSGSGSTTPPTSGSTAPSAPAQSGGDKIILQLAQPNPGTDTDHCQAFCVYFKENLESMSNGQFEVQIFPNGQLGSLRECIEGMTMGTVDMSINMNSDFGAFVSDFMVFDLPFLFTTRDEVYSVIFDKDITSGMFQKMYDQQSIKILAYGDGGFRYFLNNTRPINNLNDFAGIKLRLSESPIFVSTFKALGCNPTTLPFSECFAAIQQGTIDGLELPILSTYTAHYYEIIKYMSLTGHFFTPLTIGISAKKWDTLTDQQKALVQEAADKAAVSQTEFIRSMEDTDLAEMEKAGIKINEVPKENLAEFRKAVQPVYDEYTLEIGKELVDKVLKKLGKA